jgi:hypothetical protein
MKSKIILSLVIVMAIVNCSSFPVLDAVDTKKLAEVKKTVEAGGNPNEGDCLGALTVAAWNGDYDIVEYLLSKGADPNQRGKECEFKRPYIGRFRKANRTPIEGVKDIKVAKLLIEKGANINLTGHTEYTGGAANSGDCALRTAIEIGNIELVDLYIKNKVNFNNYLNDGENVFAFELKLLKGKNALAGAKIESLLKGKISNLAMTDAILKATDAKVLKSYTHIPTGAKTVMSDDIAQKLYDNPKNFTPITLNAADNKYYHHSEFVWDTGQNMYEWYILRNAKVNPKKVEAKK